ncbi:peroxiredoxin family protein [Actinoplanes utahensis]|uniref:Thioredoxin domain-containing protein n=1 Tax=Actinoplanes utahensis TaxID=1869 RepID=A0A0A6UKW0_ACTUT|nr:redoxin domain-containing protein [Actinoplanes utahensis]KHD76750.1 hypothetical protein MB27_15825 [Actinoplanes utahensis]GIF33182.1 hypothetical protein Aut01nite_61680 [Actinoplanes utahensis]
MLLLTAAVIALTVFVLIDLLLSAAIIRRLRDTEARLDEITPSARPGLMNGTAMPDFSDAAGTFTRAGVTDVPLLLAFFATGCRYCPTQAEQLAHRKAEIDGHGIRVVSVLTVLDDAAPDDLTPTLEKSGAVVTEHGPGGLMATFSVTGTPTFLLYDRTGTLLGSGNSIHEVMERWIP